jgi:hypothetical protein
MKFTQMGPNIELDTLRDVLWEDQPGMKWAWRCILHISRENDGHISSVGFGGCALFPDKPKGYNVTTCWQLFIQHPCNVIWKKLATSDTTMRHSWGSHPFFTCTVWHGRADGCSQWMWSCSGDIIQLGKDCHQILEVFSVVFDPRIEMSIIKSFGFTWCCHSNIF